MAGGGRASVDGDCGIERGKFEVCFFLVLHDQSQHHGSGLVGSRIMSPDPASGGLSSSRGRWG